MEADQAESFDHLFSKAETYFNNYVQVLRSYGIEPNPEMRLLHSKGFHNYYDLNDGQIYMALPGMRGGSAQLYLLFVKSTFGLQSNEDVLEMFDLLLPRIVAHEMGHSLRHRYDQFQRNNLWLEEQAANQLAMALVKRRMSPEQKRRIRVVLANAIAKLGERIDVKEIGLDSYRDVAHALNVTQQIDDSTLDNIELLRSIFTIETDELLRATGQLQDEVLQRLERRGEVIAELNEQYTKDAARYAYSHFSWMYYDFLSQQSDYVDEFGATRLGLKHKLLPEINANKMVDRIEIKALYCAYQSMKNISDTGKRFFLKRYRSCLLNRIEGSTLNVPSGQVENDLSELMEIWVEDKSDPLELLELVCPPELKELFPKRLSHDAETTILPTAKLLPTETDRRLWKHFTTGESDEEITNTLERLEILDRIPMLRPLSAELQLSLVHRMYVLKLDSGEPVLWQGERNSDIFILSEGLLEILLEEGGRSRPRHIGVIKPGSLFGEYSFITNEPAGATVRAVRSSKCYVFKGSDLKPMTYRHPAVLVQFAASLADKLNRANQATATHESDMTIVVPAPEGRLANI
jgi:CRP-like cAMP-binding protein